MMQSFVTLTRLLTRGRPAIRVVVASCLALLPCVASALPDDCNPTASPLVFGAYDTLNPTVGTATISVTCENTTGPARTFNYTLALSSGPGSYASRSMTGTGDTLSYNLYTAATYSTVWGDGTGGSVVVAGSITVPRATILVDTKTVFGRISAPQNVFPGSYSTATPLTVTLSGVRTTTQASTFNVSTTVAARCDTSATALAFGPITLLSSQTDASSSITVQCTKNSPYTVGLSAGSTTGATIAQRLMANGTNLMLYNLYSNAGRTAIWGDLIGLWVSGTGAGLAVPQTLSVYGRVANGQTNLAIGNYLETITVTVTY